MVYRGVRGLYKGFRRGRGIRGGCSGNRGSRFEDRLRVRVPYRSIFASITFGKLY